MIDLSDIRSAADRIGPFIKRTPVATCSAIDAVAGRQLLFKCEQYQKVGAFKFRGACNAVMNLSDEEAARGVVTHSSGNHAQALALAAKMRGITAHIVMPKGAPAVKRDVVKGYGGRVIECEPTLDARELAAARVQSETGAVLIHPYNNGDIIAGQGTVALELLEQVEILDAIIAPVGGGGLLSGISIAAKAINPSIRILAGEPTGADDAARSLAAGKLIPNDKPSTIAEGLHASLGDLTWPIIRDNVEQIITVNDEQIIEAMRLAWQRGKLLIESSAAVPLAALLTDTFQSIKGIDRIGVILSGGNVDLDNLPW